jgi:hypothetical protein
MPVRSVGYGGDGDRATAATVPSPKMQAISDRGLAALGASTGTAVLPESVAGGLKGRLWRC